MFYRATKKVGSLLKKLKPKSSETATLRRTSSMVAERERPLLETIGRPFALIRSLSSKSKSRNSWNTGLDTAREQSADHLLNLPSEDHAIHYTIPETVEDLEWDAREKFHDMVLSLRNKFPTTACKTYEGLLLLMQEHKVVVVRLSLRNGEGIALPSQQMKCISSDTRDVVCGGFLMATRRR